MFIPMGVVRRYMGQRTRKTAPASSIEAEGAIPVAEIEMNEDAMAEIVIEPGQIIGAKELQSMERLMDRINIIKEYMRMDIIPEGDLNLIMEVQNEISEWIDSHKYLSTSFNNFYEEDMNRLILSAALRIRGGREVRPKKIEIKNRSISFMDALNTFNKTEE